MHNAGEWTELMNLRSLMLLLCLGNAAFAQADTTEMLSVKEKQQSPASLTAPQNNLPEEFINRLKEAESGDVDAMLDIGLVYMDGTDYLPVDSTKAFTWFKKASDIGNTDGDYYLGLLAQNQQKYEEAARWYRQGAEQGDAYCQYGLGFLYERGLGVKQDYKQAKAWYSEAAEQGQSYGQFALGMFYHDGLGGDVDYKKAREWYEESAQQGVASAVNNLAVLYENGEGVEQDEERAINLYRQAANMGSATAQNNMGDFYYEGHRLIEKMTIKPFIGTNERLCKVIQMRSLPWVGVMKKGTE
ncbi:tetratricopeptide repeat protein [Providencia manganoxydans]